ncbi:MAG: flagellar export chaperone FlgN [Endozoicomonas sp. (ex Botrylloides leachii)]|nr:flagellar export chaperone FlgN [Endozoicomonas sp. (ex Botrylloides leachii)]
MTKINNDMTSQALETQFIAVCRKMQSNFQDALALSRKLEKVLETAHVTMLNRDMPNLEKCLAQQMKLLNLLQVNGALREHCLSQIDCSADRAGIMAFFSQAREKLSSIVDTAGNYSTMHQFWLQLEDVATRCQQLNHANGRLLARLAANTRKMCNLVMTGQAGMTYDKTGLMVSPLDE